MNAPELAATRVERCTRMHQLEVVRDEIVARLPGMLNHEATIIQELRDVVANRLREFIVCSYNAAVGGFASGDVLRPE